jgi:hypothetical protein
MSRDPEEQYKHDTYLNQKSITRDVLEASLGRTWFHQGTSCRDSTDRPALPPNSSLTLYLTIFYIRRADPTLENYSSLDCDRLLEEVGSPFIGGHQAIYGPMNPWQRTILALDMNQP